MHDLNFNWVMKGIIEEAREEAVSIVMLGAILNHFGLRQKVTINSVV